VSSRQRTCLNIARSSLLLLAVVAAVGLLSWRAVRGDGPRDNLPTQVRPIPPVGNDLDPADRDSLQADLDALGRRIDNLQKKWEGRPDLLAYLPDVQIFYNAVRYPLAYHETIEPGMARRALSAGRERARLLEDGQTPWAKHSGPRGFISRIDGSVQPYVLHVPREYREQPAGAQRKFRMDVWGHGRDELLTELRFVMQDDELHELRYLDLPTEPPDKFILSLYGRYITAYKFAGEIDGLEAMEAVRRQYPIDENRMLVIGFSLGGTCAWQYAVHYPDLWAAAAPGAGLAETRRFLKFFQDEDVSTAPWYQQALWHLYDSTDYVANLASLPTIAYAGELDRQKQASDVMLEAAAPEGVDLQRIVGRRIGHHFTKEAMHELEQRLDKIIARGRNPLPAKLRFTTWTLRYNRMYWLTLDRLVHHWQRARADGGFTNAADGSIDGFTLNTQNVAALTLSFPPGSCPVAAGHRPKVRLDGVLVQGPPVAEDRSWSAQFAKTGDGWRAAEKGSDASSLHKRHGLQGPIDDAFMDRFLIVRPTGKPLNNKTGTWVNRECRHAIDHWRLQFRGEARAKDDVQVTDQDMADGNLVLFGDPSSNRLIARLADKLPIRWTERSITLGDRSFPADHHVPVLVYPNPLHASHYVVLNSGFTYREYDYLNNARQTPKLPDYAVLDVDQPPTTQVPGGIAAAGFFDEEWKLLPDEGRSAVAAGKF
jgi:pimeloyl-ACP methyl ester carboxylesterase